MSKDKLLAVGERYEAMITADKAADAKVPLSRRDIQGKQLAGSRRHPVLRVRAGARGIRARHDHLEESRARRPVPGAVLLHQRRAVAAHRGRVPRHRAGAGLRGRGDGAVPVRGHDARHQHGAAAQRLHALCGAGLAGGRRGHVRAGGRAVRTRPRRQRGAGAAARRRPTTATPRSWGGCSTRSTCSRSSWRQCCCWSPIVAAIVLTMRPAPRPEKCRTWARRWRCGARTRVRIVQVAPDKREARKPDAGGTP